MGRRCLGKSVEAEAQMLKVCSLAALALLGTTALVAAQGPEQHGKQDGGRGGPAAGPSPAPQRASPPPPQQRPAARAPQAPPAAARANEAQPRRAAEQQRAAQQQRRAQEQTARAAQQRQTQERASQQRRQAQEQARAAQERARTQKQAQERTRLDQQRRAAEQDRTRAAAEQQRANERRQAAEKQRAAERGAVERRRADEQRAAEQRRAAERTSPALRPGANQPITARHEQLRQERAKLSRDQHVRLRQAFTVSRERITRVQFTKRIGTRIPRSIRLFAVPAAVLAIFPYYRDYRYVVEEDTICIVDPETYEIVDVLDEGTYAPAPRPQVAELVLTDRERILVLDSIPPDFPRVRLRLRLALGAEIPPSLELYEFAPLLVDQAPKLRDFRFEDAEEQGSKTRQTAVQSRHCQKDRSRVGSERLACKASPIT